MTAKVVVWCTVFNHEKFLRKCLDGFVMQKTNFPFEVIVHDDASTDYSPEIIREYEKKYPDIIKPIYEKINQYSLGIEHLNALKFRNIDNSKYFAVCEGDDYWSSPYKLQKQYDYMEKHPECSICLHNTVIHDLSGKSPNRNFFSWNKTHHLTEKEVFFGWHVHTTSYFVRTDKYKDLPKVFWNVWCGDYVYLTYLFTKGSVVALPDVMSVYNYANPAGSVAQHNRNFDLIKKSLLTRKKYLDDLLKITDERFHKVIKARMYEIDLSIKMLEYDTKKNTYSKKNLNRMRKEITNNPFYTQWKMLQGKKEKLRAYLKYETRYGSSLIKFYKKVKSLVKR